MLHQGHRARTPRLELYWATNAVGHPRLGVIVPRYGASAPARNQLRRRLRERARRFLPTLAPLDFVIRARHEAYAARPRELAQDLDRWVRSLEP